MTACGSLTRKFSPLPRPTASGLPRRAPMMTSGTSRCSNGDAVGADDLLERGARGVEQAGLGMLAPGVVVNLADEVDQDFGVSLGTETVPGFEQRGAQGLVILDDAVVDQRETARLVVVRVGVLVVGLRRAWPSGCGKCRRGPARGFCRAGRRATGCARRTCGFRAGRRRWWSARRNRSRGTPAAAGRRAGWGRRLLCRCSRRFHT